MAASRRDDDIAAYSIDELSDLLVDKLSEGVLLKLREEKICGEDFLCLNEDQLKEMFPVMGERMKVSRIIKELKPAELKPSDSLTEVTYRKKLNSSGSTSWVHTFEIPTVFSRRTLKAIQTGPMTKSARIEIVAALHSRMLQKQPYPSPYEYMVACQRLIECYPSLQDKIGNGIGTWKEQLKQKFRNGRRSEDVSISEGSEICEELVLPTPPKKKKKKACRADSDGILLTEGEASSYELNVHLLAEEHAKDQPSLGKIKKLMKDTFGGRRKWIMTDMPQVHSVVEIFPALKNSQRLRRELTLILTLSKDHNFVENWNEWQSKTLKYAELEARRRNSLALIFSEYSSTSDTISEDQKGIIVIKLLKVLLAARSRLHIVYEFKDSVDLPSEIAKIDNVAPSIAITKTDSDVLQFFIIAEKQVICESDSFTIALVDMIATYFTFNMSYPDPLYALLLFVQHHILSIKDDQSVPNVVNIIFSAMDKL